MEDLIFKYLHNVIACYRDLHNKIISALFYIFPSIFFLSIDVLSVNFYCHGNLLIVTVKVRLIDEQIDWQITVVRKYLASIIRHHGGMPM